MSENNQKPSKRILTFTAIDENRKERQEIAFDDPKYPSYEEVYQWYMQNEDIQERWKRFDEETKHKLADGDAKAILAFKPQLKERFLHWWLAGELIDDLEVEGYTIGYILREKNQWLPNAFFVFEDLMNDPENSVAREYLGHGLSMIKF